MWCKKRKRKAEGRNVDDSAKQSKTELKEGEQEITTSESTNTVTQSDGSGSNSRDKQSSDSNSIARKDTKTNVQDSHTDNIDGKVNQSYHSKDEVDLSRQQLKATFEYNHSSNSGSHDGGHVSEYIESAQYEQLSPASDSQSSRPYVQESEYRSYGYTKESRENQYEHSSRYDDNYRYREQYEYSHDADRSSYAGNASRRIPSPRERSDAFLRW